MVLIFGLIHSFIWKFFYKHFDPGIGMACDGIYDLVIIKRLHFIPMLEELLTKTKDADLKLYCTGLILKKKQIQQISKNS